MEVIFEGMVRVGGCGLGRGFQRDLRIFEEF